MKTDKRAKSLVLRCVLSAVAVLAAAVATSGQGIPYQGRLSPLPVNSSTASTMMGSGSITAVLTGNVLTIAGTFDGMNSPATMAHVHRAPKGLRGPRLWDLEVSAAKSGRLSGKVTLTPAQVEDLGLGRFYVQIHSELNTEGHLRGWLLK